MTVGNSNQPRGVRSRAVFVTVISAVFVSNLDLFVVNVALPDIGRDLDGASLAALSWVLNAYAIVFAALLVVAGRVADRTGHKRGFMAGLLVFTLGSILCALSADVTWLVGSRIVQAAGAAILIPTSLALLLQTTPPQGRATVVRAWSAMGAVAAALGPVVGGLLTQLDWRWVFLINVPIGVAALIAGTKVLPDVRGDRSDPLPDVLGAALLTVSVGALALGLVQAEDWGWASGGVIGCFAVAAVLGAWVFARARTHQAPIIELPLLRLPVFGSATLAALLFTVAFAAMILSAVLWLQNAWGYSPLSAGLAFAPGPLMVPALALGAGPLVHKIGSRWVAALGNLLLGAGVLWWALAADTTPNYLSGFLPGLITGGAGVGLALATLIAAATSSLPPTRLATGSGVINMARQVGAVLGVAVLVGMLGTPATPAATLAAFQNGWLAIVITCAVAALAALAIRTIPAVSPAPRTTAPTEGARP